MFFINFGRWNSSHGPMFSMYRVYKNGYRWTPIIEITRRYTQCDAFRSWETSEIQITDHSKEMKDIDQNQPYIKE